MSRYTRRLSPLLFALLPACAGIGGGDIDVDDPALEAAITLQKESFQVGETLVAEVEVRNVGDLPVSIPRLSRYTMRFFLRPESSPDPLETTFFASPDEVVEFENVDAGAIMKRRFLLPLATAHAGRFQLIGTYHTEGDQAVESAATIGVSGPAVDIREPVLLKRDSTGQILREEAERLALEHCGAGATLRESNLVEDAFGKIPSWAVTLDLAAPDEHGESTRTCLVNVYTGWIQRREIKTPGT